MIPWFVLATLIASGVGSVPAPGRLLRFDLTETPQKIRAQFGAESHVVQQRGLRVLEYQEEGSGHAGDCDGTFAWGFFFEWPQQRLSSVSYNPETPLAPRTLIGDRPYRVHHASDGSHYAILTAELDHGLILVAPGSASPDEPTAQFQLLRKTDIARFYPGLNLH